jgi:hypothetical protein
LSLSNDSGRFLGIPWLSSIKASNKSGFISVIAAELSGPLITDTSGLFRRHQFGFRRITQRGIESVKLLIKFITHG